MSGFSCSSFAIRMAVAGATLLGAWVGDLSAQDRTIRVPLLEDGRSPIQKDWRWTTDFAGEEWAQPGFDDTAWPLAQGGFGTGELKDARIATPWTPMDIWIRKSFNMADANPEALILTLHHDEDARVYLNGSLVREEAGWSGEYSEIHINDEFKALLKPEGNVLAIHCRNTDGPGYIDAGLSYTVTRKASSIIADARIFPEEWKYSTTAPAGDWTGPDFADADWNVGRGGFGSPDNYSATSGTEWLAGDIWLRRKFTVETLFAHYLASYMHDDGMDVYLNGTLVLQDPVFTDQYREQVLVSVAKAMKPGENIIAIYCHNNDGPQYVDFGLQGLENPTPTAAKRTPSGRTLADRNLSPGYAGARKVLFAAQGRLDLAGLAAGSAGRLEVFSLDGYARGTLPAGADTETIGLPGSLGTGMFRYLWHSPSGMRQGTLVNMR